MARAKSSPVPNIGAERMPRVSIKDFRARRVLSDLDHAALIDVRDTALAHLVENPLDKKGAAEAANVTMKTLSAVAEKYADDFNEVDEMFFSELEHLSALQTLGKVMPLGYELFDTTKALKILEKLNRQRWGKGVKLEEKQKDANGSGKNLLEKHLERKAEWQTSKIIEKFVADVQASTTPGARPDYSGVTKESIREETRGIDTSAFGKDDGDEFDA